MLIEQLHTLFLQHPVVTTDSRNCPKESLFFALKGDNFDGNRYASTALEAGASYAIIDNPEYEQPNRTILVDDVLTTLQMLARFHRSTFQIPVIAITGTNGKTTTKELLAAVLSSQYNTLYTEGNLNNQIGVPLTLLRLTPKHQLSIIEMGASHPGDIKELVDIALPTHGLITNVGKAHLEGFGSFEGVINTKAELYTYLKNKHATIFIQQENEMLQKLAMGANTFSYGKAKNAMINGIITNQESPFLSFNWREFDGVNHAVSTHLIGGYNLENALAAIAVGRYFNISSSHINNALAAYQPKNNRSQFSVTPHNRLIVDAYNANPSSMRVALDNFKALQTTPKAVILGDMRELGATSLAEHAAIVEQLKEGAYDKVFLCGTYFMECNAPFTTFSTTEELLQSLSVSPLVGFHILIKGSRGIHLEKIIPFL